MPLVTSRDLDCDLTKNCVNFSIDNSMGYLLQFTLFLICHGFRDLKGAGTRPLSMRRKLRFPSMRALISSRSREVIRSWNSNFGPAGDQVENAGFMREKGGNNLKADQGPWGKVAKEPSLQFWCQGYSRSLTHKVTICYTSYNIQHDYHFSQFKREMRIDLYQWPLPLTLALRSRNHDVSIMCVSKKTLQNVQFWKCFYSFREDCIFRVICDMS